MKSRGPQAIINIIAVGRRSPGDTSRVRTDCERKLLGACQAWNHGALVFSTPYTSHDLTFGGQSTTGIESGLTRRTPRTWTCSRHMPSWQSATCETTHRAEPHIERLSR